MVGGGSNYTWFPFSLPRLDNLLRPSGEATYTATVNNSHVLLPHATSHYYHDDAASSQSFFYQSFFPNEWQAPFMSDEERVDGNAAEAAGAIQSTEMPKLEDFLGSSMPNPCSDAVTETQDSSPSTCAYEGSHLHFSSGQFFEDHDQLSAITAPARVPALSGGNSGSGVDDSASVSGNNILHLSGYSPDSGTEIALACPQPLRVVAAAAPENAAVARASTPTAQTQRTSIYRGVTRHRWTGRYEAHLWDNTCRREGQKRKGRQVYLGGYDKEEKAARSYDLAALKYWGPTASTNFAVSSYSKEIEEMENMTKQEFIASLRRKSSGFSRGASIYRGVTRHHHHGRWQARIGRVAGNKDLYLGTFSTEEEAAEAYDIAAIKFRGVNAVTNFELGRYDLEAIAISDLPIGGSAKRLKLSLPVNHHGQLSAEGAGVSVHPNSGAFSLLNNLMQQQISVAFTPARPTTDLCGQNFYWLTANSQHNHQIDTQQATYSD